MDQPPEFLAPNGPPDVLDPLQDDDTFAVYLAALALQNDPPRSKTKIPPGIAIRSSSEDHWPNVRHTSPDTVCCAHCKTQIAFATQILSKDMWHGTYYMIAPPALHADHLYCPAFCNIADISRTRKYIEDEDEDEDKNWVYDEDDEDMVGEVDEEDEADKPLMPSHSHFARKDFAMRWRSNNLANVVLGRLNLEEDRDFDDDDDDDGSDHIFGVEFSIQCDAFCAICGNYLGQKMVDNTNPRLEFIIGRFLIYPPTIIIRKHSALASDVDVKNMDASWQQSQPPLKPDSDSDSRYFVMRSQNAIALAAFDPVAAAMAHNSARLRRAKALQYRDDPALMDFNTRRWRDELCDGYEACMNCCVSSHEQSARSAVFTSAATTPMHRRCQWNVSRYRSLMGRERDSLPASIAGSKNDFSERERRNLVVAPHLEFDDDDDDEMDMLLAGEWDPIAVARMRKAKRAAAAFTRALVDCTEKWMYETQLVGVIVFVGRTGSGCIVVASVVAVHLTYYGFVPYVVLGWWFVCAGSVQYFLWTRQYDLFMARLAANGFIGLDCTAPGRLLRLQEWVASHQMDAKNQYRAIRYRIRCLTRQYRPSLESWLFWMCTCILAGGVLCSYLLLWSRH